MHRRIGKRVDLAVHGDGRMATGALKKSDLKRVTVDTTGQEKSVTYPTDAKLLNRVRERLVKKARVAGLKHRQSYMRELRSDFSK